MKIANTGPVSSTSLRSRDRTSRSSASFAGELAGSGSAREAAPPAGVSATNPLFALQEIGDSLEGRRRAVERGEDLLDRLDELRIGLLTGTFPADRLDQLLELVRRKKEFVADPGLAEILTDIELRASVELAKLGRYS